VFLLQSVMAGLVPATYTRLRFRSGRRGAASPYPLPRSSWVAGTSPAMTAPLGARWISQRSHKRRMTLRGRP